MIIWSELLYNKYYITYIKYCIIETIALSTGSAITKLTDNRSEFLKH